MNPLSAPLAFLLPALVAQAQSWEAIKNATGWARFDKDFSCTFHNPIARKLVTVMRDGTVVGEIDISKLEAPPEKWVLDPSGNAWVIAGGVAQFIDKNGKLGTNAKLPGEVADLAWDPKGFVLSYRTAEPYVEKRDYKGGATQWTYGPKPKKGERQEFISHRVLVNDENHVILASGNSMQLTMIDGSKGKMIGQAVFSYNDQMPPAIDLLGGDRGAGVWWLNRGTAITSYSSSQIPSLGAKGMVLVRQDFTASTLTIIKTELADGHFLIGALENEAILISPKGGVVSVPLGN